MEPELAEELPGIGLVLAPVEARPGKSPPDVKRRLRALADRYTGGKVIHMRQDAGAMGLPGVRAPGRRGPRHRPHAGGARSRSTGCKHGGLPSESLLDDALTIAVAETGVPVIALDPDRLDGQPGLRLCRAG